ncbi:MULTISPECIES: DNA circularization protein [Vibrio]|uniref:Prophage MuSo2, DNA circulation protein, putative n=2 Tax=Vibrio TaxID=662 RepID=F9S6A0_9VIBR|nr:MULTISPECIES: DNA circularization N-terminal domain-containing protein [Vibrio]EGU33938.1 prophage MuSo2, DNA circulation protein, putative [Vibrio ichthyoenteri ATCC 700023]ODS10919.1 Mu-like prophage FluMu DNA circularization protein [Vibrio scophthalmi]
MSEDIERLEASFRGVSFPLESVKGKSGRRAIAHEYPKRDGGFAEDNGGVLNNETIRAVFVGPAAEQEFESLVAALNVAGPGELVHPWFGILQVQVGEVDYEFNNDEFNIARVSFQIYAAGNDFTIERVDSQNDTCEKSDQAKEANLTHFEEQTQELTPEQELTLGESIDNALNDLDNFVADLPGLPKEIGQWVDRLEHAKYSVSSLLAYPGELMREVTNLVQDVGNLVTEMPQSLEVYDQMSNRWKGMSEAYNPTWNSDQAKTQELTYQTLQTAAVIAKVDAIVAAPVTGEDGGFSDSEQAKDASETLNNQLNDLAENAIESGNRLSWRSLRVLRTAAAKDLSERIRQLPNVVVISPRNLIPVALLAYQQTGDTEQRNQIIKRNKLSRPSFITVHHQVEVVKRG